MSFTSCLVRLLFHRTFSTARFRCDNLIVFTNVIFSKHQTLHESKYCHSIDFLITKPSAYYLFIRCSTFIFIHTCFICNFILCVICQRLICKNNSPHAILNFNFLSGCPCFVGDHTKDGKMCL